MARKIAVLEYSFIFDPSDTWSSGYEFENQLADYFAAHGIEAEIVETAGGTGRRVIFMQRMEVKMTEPQKPNTQARDQIRQVQQKAPPKDYKKFIKPKHFDNRPPKPVYSQGRANRQKVRI